MCLLEREKNKKMFKKFDTLLDLCVSSLRRGHANLLCIVPILTDDPRRESDSQCYAKQVCALLPKQVCGHEHTRNTYTHTHIHMKTIGIEVDTIRLDMIYDTIRYDTMRYNTILRNDTIRHDATRDDTIRYDTMRYNTIRYDTIRHDTTRHITTR